MNQRPLSPHLQVYRLPLTAWISITHRAAGVFLSLGMIPLLGLLVALALGPKPFDLVLGLLQSVIGQLFIWGWIYALLFHFCHGIRHLLWDAGLSFDRATLNRYALYEIAASVLLMAVVLLAVMALS
jgi:succinate dehydrogenase / fumarate reductase cytochrome b subunit